MKNSNSKINSTWPVCFVLLLWIKVEVIRDVLEWHVLVDAHILKMIEQTAFLIVLHKWPACHENARKASIKLALFLTDFRINGFVSLFFYTLWVEHRSCDNQDHQNDRSNHHWHYQLRIFLAMQIFIHDQALVEIFQLFCSQQVDFLFGFVVQLELFLWVYCGD